MSENRSVDLFHFAAQVCLSEPRFSFSGPQAVGWERLSEALPGVVLGVGAAEGPEEPDGAGVAKRQQGGGRGGGGLGFGVSFCLGGLWGRGVWRFRFFFWVWGFRCFCFWLWGGEVWGLWGGVWGWRDGVEGHERLVFGGLPLLDPSLGGEVEPRRLLQMIFLSHQRSSS